jgi:uncharacterized protein YbjQ (UPF0145 family)
MREWLLAIPLLLAAGCVHAGASRHGHGHGAEPSAAREDDPSVIAAAARVKVLTGSGLDCRGEALGIVDVHEPVSSEAQALELLKRRAAALGAEAIVGVEFRHGSGGAAPTHLSGMAMRCNDLLKGRAYEELAMLEVAGDMGHEDDAFDELKTKARALGANLILDIRFEHGEATGRTMLRGKAIRVR